MMNPEQISNPTRLRSKLINFHFRHILLCVLWLMMLESAGAAQFPTRPADQVLDQLRVLSENDRSALVGMVQRSHQANEDLAVAMIASTEGVPPRAYATDLFNHWQLGDAYRNRGVLIFIAIEDRKAELILGSGIDDTEMQAAADTIMQTKMLPQFRSGSFGAGAFYAAESVLEKMFGLRVEASSAEQSSVQRSEVAEIEAARVVESYGDTEPSSAKITPIGWAFLGIPVAGFSWLGARFYRSRIRRRCPGCAHGMYRLEEAKDDAYLSAEANLEEQLDSVQHDVWICSRCSQAEILSRERWFSAYSRCTKCQAKTVQSEKIEDTAASYSSDGWGTLHSDCKNCGNHSKRRYTIRRLQERSAGNSIGSYSSYSSSSSSSSSGGRSSGGGASGSW